MSDEELEGVEDERIKKLIKDSRQQAEQNATDRAAIEAERLDVGFDRANIPSSGPGLLFRENYKGDPSAEAIRAAAEKYGISGASSSVDEQRQRDEQSREDELNRLRSSSQSVGNQSIAPNAEAELMAQLLATNGDPDLIMDIVRQHNLRMDTSDSGSARFQNG